MSSLRSLLVALVALVVLVVVGAACAPGDAPPDATGAIDRGVVLAPGRPRPPEQDAALRALSPGGPTRVRVGALLASHAHAHAHSHAALELPTDDELRTQLRTARHAATRLVHLGHLEDAGYYLGSYFSPGVGVHYIDWRRVSRPFDPAHPAMLLVDATPGHQVRLAGFSYWVRSRHAPEGFAGNADVWHQHRGMCFVDGLLARDGVATAGDCDGTWLNGGDLWMLHAWVVPGYPNDAGVFAPANRALCPARRGPETSWC